MTNFVPPEPAPVASRAGFAVLPTDHSINLHQDFCKPCVEIACELLSGLESNRGVYADELGYKYSDLSIKSEIDLKEAFERTIANLRDELYIVIRPLDEPYTPV